RSDVDHALNEINSTTDPTQKLALIQKFADGPGKEGNYPLVADGLFVDYYLNQKNYDKAFEYGDKVFALDPDSFQNAINMVRASAEKSDVDRLISYGEKAGAIIRDQPVHVAFLGGSSHHVDRTGFFSIRE